MIGRVLEKTIKSKLHSGKAIVLLGARQVGKTTLLKTIFGTSDEVFWLNGDEIDVQALFAAISATRLKAIFGDKKIIIIDEAQRIHDIGLRMKLITDQIPEVQLVVTGSSSFELANKLNESLTGRLGIQNVPLVFWRNGCSSWIIRRKASLAPPYGIWLLPRRSEPCGDRKRNSETALK